MNPFPRELFRLGPLVVSDTVLVSVVLTLLLVGGARLALLFAAPRRTLEILYEELERSISNMSRADVHALVPLVLTQWVFIGAANLVGLVPGVSSPTRDLSLAASLAAISFVAGHVYALSQRGLSYLKHYLEPNPFLLPFNVLGELSRTIALALRLFGNMMSGSLVSAIFVYLAGLLVPVPLMLLSALTAVVQAYIFGVLTLVFAVGSLEATHPKPRKTES
jgi:F-type H+-transporting ATPase subunit a